MSARLARAFAKGIRAERARLGISQEELARRMSWSQTTVSDIEGGRRTIAADDLADLCRELGAPLARILVAADPADLEALGL